MDNRTLISKAAVDTATLGAGGKMSPEQAKQFITFMKDYSAFLRQVNFINMTKTSRELDSLEVNKRSIGLQTSLRRKAIKLASFGVTLFLPFIPYFNRVCLHTRRKLAALLSRVLPSFYG